MANNRFWFRGIFWVLLLVLPACGKYDSARANLNGGGGGTGSAEPIEGNDPIRAVVTAQEALAHKAVLDLTAPGAPISEFGKKQASGDQLAALQYLASQRLTQLRALAAPGTAVSFEASDSVAEDRDAQTANDSSTTVFFNRKSLKVKTWEAVDLLKVSGHELCHKIKDADATRFDGLYIRDEAHFYPFQNVTLSGHYLCDLFGAALRDWAIDRNLVKKSLLQNFVKKVVRQVFERAVTVTELDAAVTSLEQGETREHYALGLIQSDEGVKKALGNLYYSIFTRYPSATGLDSLLARYRNESLTLRDFAKEWFLTNAFWTSYDSNGTSYIRIVFSIVFKRLATDADVIAALPSVNLGPTGRALFIGNVIGSLEHRSVQYRTWFSLTQGRSATASESTAGAARLANESWDLVFAQLLASETYLLKP